MLQRYKLYFYLIEKELEAECPGETPPSEGSYCLDENAKCKTGNSGIQCLCIDTHRSNNGTCVASK